MFADSLEMALLYFLREGAVSHILGRAPFAFQTFTRACALLDGLLSEYLCLKTFILKRFIFVCLF